MADFKFGDILRYPDSEGVGDSILFMFLHCDGAHNWVMVLRDKGAPWGPGYILPAGLYELVLHTPRATGTRIFVDGKDVTDEVKFIGTSAFEIPGHLVDREIEIEWSTDV